LNANQGACVDNVIVHNCTNNELASNNCWCGNSLLLSNSGACVNNVIVHNCSINQPSSSCWCGSSVYVPN